MKGWLVVIPLLPFAAGAQIVVGSDSAFPDAAAPCSAACQAQTFDLNPFSTGVWTPGGGNGCPIEWDSANGRLQRTVTSDAGCDNSNGLARYNAEISRDSCAKFQIVTSNDGADNHDTGFEPGFVLRHQLDSNPKAESGDMNQGAWVLRCETGLNCNSMRLTTAFNVDDFALTCTEFGTLEEGDWIGACIRGTGPGTVIKVFNFGAADPGVPDDTDGSGAWATAVAANAIVEAKDSECTFDASFASPSTVCAPALGFCDDAGKSWGVWMRTNDVTAGGEYEVDNFSTYSCQ